MKNRRFRKRQLSVHRGLLVVCLIFTCVTVLQMTMQQLHAFAYIFVNEFRMDVVTHPIGYTGSGGTLTVTVGIDPTSVNATAMVTPTKNVVYTWNQMEPTTNNLTIANVPGSSVDFESVLLHEMGHSIGLAHPNAASESGLTGANRNYTKALDGSNNTFDLNSGSDMVRGSGDDVRGDDVNLHWYNIGLNNPFTLPTTVDSTTYMRDLAGLPAGDTFAANADRDVSALFGTLAYNPMVGTHFYDSLLSLEQEVEKMLGLSPARPTPPPLPNSVEGMFYWPGEPETIESTNSLWALYYAGSTEAVMQQGSFFGEAQRTLGHDDVAGILYAETGLDEVAGTSDDYDLILAYIGLTTSADIVIDFDNSQTGFAVSSSFGTSINSTHWRITSNNIYFNSNYNWFFNPDLSCVPMAPMVTISQSGNDIELSWPVVSGADRYEIWSDVDAPYLQPGNDCSGATNCTSQTATTFTDNNAVGNVNENMSYLVLAVNDSCEAQDTSSRVAEFDYALEPGA